jgi:hypothetical protein
MPESRSWPSSELSTLPPRSCWLESSPTRRLETPTARSSVLPVRVLLLMEMSKLVLWICKDTRNRCPQTDFPVPSHRLRVQRRLTPQSQHPQSTKTLAGQQEPPAPRFWGRGDALHDRLAGPCRKVQMPFCIESASIARVGGPEPC